MAESATSPLLVLISAPSGAGKTTLCDNLLAADGRLTRAITCTTRPPRSGERDGKDYYFLTPDEFQRRVDAGEFLEHASVYDRAYGTLRTEVFQYLDAGRDVLLNVDVQGAAAVRRQAETDAALRAALVTVFLTLPSRAELESRLRGRGSESEEELQRRLQQARLEMEQWPAFDYLVVSGTREDDRRRLEVVVQAERLRVLRSAPPSEEGGE